MTLSVLINELPFRSLKWCSRSGSVIFLQFSIECYKCNTKTAIKTMILLTKINSNDFVMRIRFFNHDLGVLRYKRPGQDSKVSWSPPSALRRIDVLLCDEASQLADAEWQRFFTGIWEQHHLPYTLLCADFQQLAPVGSGGPPPFFSSFLFPVLLLS